MFTSGDAALFSVVDENNPALTHDDTSWKNTSRDEGLRGYALDAYYTDKALAEKTAWKFAAKPGFPALTVVNPAYVFGPQAFDSEAAATLNFTNESLSKIIKADPNGEWLNEMGGFIHVSDIARAHLAAFEQENTIGKRLYVTNGPLCFQMILDIMNTKIPRLRGKVPVGKPETGPAPVLALAKTDNTATRKLLNFEVLSLEQCVIDFVAQLTRAQPKIFL